MFTEGELAHENRPIRFHYPVKKINQENVLFFFSWYNSRKKCLKELQLLQTVATMAKIELLELRNTLELLGTITRRKLRY